MEPQLVELQDFTVLMDTLKNGVVLLKILQVQGWLVVGVLLFRAYQEGRKS